MPSKHISPCANTSNHLCNCPDARKTYFTQCQHLIPPLHLPPCPQNTFRIVPTPRNPFSTAPMPSKNISPSANSSNTLCNCPHALKIHFTQCQHLKPPFQLHPCPQTTFHPVATPQNSFSTAPMAAKHMSPSANILNALFKSQHALKTHFGQYQHLKPPLQLPPCPQTTFHPVPTCQTPFTTAPMPSKHISASANTSNPPLQLPPCLQNTFHPVPTPRTPFATAPMPSKHISPSANMSNPLCNCPHALKAHFTQCQHLTPPFQLPPCPQNTFHPVPTCQNPFSTAAMPSKHISPGAITSNSLFNCPCPQTTFHPVSTPQTSFSTAPMPSKFFSPIANTSNPLFNCPINSIEDADPILCCSSACHRAHSCLYYNVQLCCQNWQYWFHHELSP